MKEGESLKFKGNIISVESIFYEGDQDNSAIIISVNNANIPVKVSNELYNRPYPYKMPRIYEQGLLVMIVEFNEKEVHLSINEREEEPEISKRATIFKSQPPAVLQGNLGSGGRFGGDLDEKQVYLMFFVDLKSNEFIAINKETGERQVSQLKKKIVNLGEFPFFGGSLEDYLVEILESNFTLGYKEYIINIDNRQYFDDNYNFATMVIINAENFPHILLYPYGCDNEGTLKYPKEKDVISKFGLEERGVIRSYITSVNFINGEGVSLIINDEKTSILNEEKNFYQLSTGEYLILRDVEKRGEIYYIRFCLDKEDELGLIPSLYKPENILTEKEIQEARCQGCLDLEECIPYNSVKKNYYCDFATKQLQSQKLETQKCDGDFQCYSGFCRDERCVSAGVWDRFLEWLRRWFG